MATFTPLKKSCLFLFAFLGVVSYLFPPVVSALPKDKKAAGSTAASTEKPAPQKPSVRPTVIDYDDMANINTAAPTGRQAAGYFIIGPQRPLYPIPGGGVQYVNVRKGHPETAGGGNHMRRQVKASGSGVVHMVYRVWDGDSTNETTYNPYDTNFNTNGFFFYNAYDCGGGNALLCDYTIQNGKCYPMIRPPDPPETRVTKIQGGGIFVRPGGSNVPVVYGQRFIQRPEFGIGAFSGRGWATMKDSAECRGKFSMDTSYNAFTAPAAIAPVMRPLDSNVWVATFRNGGFPEQIAFSYTTDAGINWSPRTVLPTNSPWFNSTEIASNGYDFYIVSMADPADPTAFQTTERPVCLKGTYNPGTQTVTFGTMQDITGNFELPGFLGNMLDIAATMVGDTLVVAWTDWNNWLGNGFPGPGGHVHSALVFPDGTKETHKIANIDIDGRLPKITTTAYGFGVDPWSQVELSYDETNQVMYALWEQPPPDSSGGAPNFQWADYEATGTLATQDLFCSASPNRGRAWDNPTNITKTNNPGCTGEFGDECANEYWFSADDRVSNDTIWIVSLVNAYPGFQESTSDVFPDFGPWTQTRDLFRLYKVPARAPVVSLRAYLGALPTDTLRLFQMKINPGGPEFCAELRLENVGLQDFFLDSLKFDPTFNQNGLVTTTNSDLIGQIRAGDSYEFQICFDPSGVTLAEQGLHSGLLKAYLRSTASPNSPAGTAAEQVTLSVNMSLYVLQTLCFNRKVRIHSGNNSTDVGSQGTIKDQAGDGMRYIVDGSDRFYDGGILVANSSLRAAEVAYRLPRKVTYQLYSDKFLRCLQDIVLDSTPGTGSYYNLNAVSISTDVEDSSLLFKNIWEQSTHPDSSDFLLQTTQLWNIASRSIDSVAMGVLYDVDVQGGGSAAGENVGGDTSVTYQGRKFWLGWIAGNDVSVDTCSSNNGYYGVVVIPGGIGNPGDSIHPKGAVICENSYFGFWFIAGGTPGGDTLVQRWMYNLNVCTSTRRRQHDTLTGVWQDTVGNPPYSVCGGATNPATYRQTGPPYRSEMAYLTVAKKVTNYQPSSSLSALTARYGLQGAAAHLAAGVDSSFPGGESYTVIHVGSVSGLSALMASAVKGIDWYVKHKNYQTGPYQISDDTLNQNYYEGRKGDLDFSNTMNPADVGGILSIVFAGAIRINGRLIPLCVADLDGNGLVSPSDFARVLNAVYVCNPAPCSYSPTALQQCSH